MKRKKHKRIKTHPRLAKLIETLKELALKENAPIWKRIAKELNKPTRQRIVVNLMKINKYVNENEIALVPGKVLSMGELTKKLTVAAFQFSERAKEKIIKSGGKALTIEELIKQNPKGSNTRIIG